MPGQDTIAKFDFDFRNTWSPVIGDGYMDMFFLGELTYDGSTCEIESDDMNFMNGNTFSQLVVSESAATCALNSISNSPIGEIHLDSNKIA